MISTRFSKAFPIVSQFLVKKRIVIFTCLSFAALAGLYSPHLSLSIVILMYVLLSYSLERRHLNNLLLTPLTVLSIYSFLGLGIGSVLMLVANSGEFDPYLFLMQLAYVLTFPLMLVIYAAFTQQFPAFSLPDVSSYDAKSFYKPLKIIGWIFLIYAFLALLTGVITGSADRGYSGDFIVENKYGIWTIFVIFSRFQYLSFILIPLLTRDSNWVQRYSINFLLAVYLILCFAIGSRGALFYPILHILVGYWMFGGSGKVLKRALIIVSALAFFLIPFMDAYRNTDAFNSSALSNPIERLAAVTETNELLNDPNRVSNLWITGRALIGADDMLIYENTPSVISYAEWENIDALIYIWIPKLVAPWKPLLIDGNEIVVSYTGIRYDRSSANISFNGDMYRRFGWLGIFIGNFIFALLYSFVISYVFFIYFNKNALFGFLLILLSLSFLMNIPNSTLLSTFWIWLWDIPKYVIALIFLYKFATYHIQKGQAILPAKKYINGS